MGNDDDSYQWTVHSTHVAEETNALTATMDEVYGDDWVERLKSTMKGKVKDGR